VGLGLFPSLRRHVRVSALGCKEQNVAAWREIEWDQAALLYWAAVATMATKQFLFASELGRSWAQA